MYIINVYASEAIFFFQTMPPNTAQGRITPWNVAPVVGSLIKKTPKFLLLNRGDEGAFSGG